MPFGCALECGDLSDFCTLHYVFGVCASSSCLDLKLLWLYIEKNIIRFQLLQAKNRNTVILLSSVLLLSNQELILIKTVLVSR